MGTTLFKHRKTQSKDQGWISSFLEGLIGRKNIKEGISVQILPPRDTIVW